MMNRSAKEAQDRSIRQLTEIANSILKRPGDDILLDGMYISRTTPSKTRTPVT